MPTYTLYMESQRTGSSGRVDIQPQSARAYTLQQQTSYSN